VPKPVNADEPLLPQLFENAMRQLRAGLYELSDNRYPGLRTRHYRLLSYVPDDGIRLARVVEASGLSKQALAQTLAPLEDGGYLRVTSDPTDGRARIVRRTDRGREVLSAVRVMQAEYERRWIEQVGAERWAGAKSVFEELFGG
jgi:DNA-binding MarR family transcriptional regulator